MVTVPGNGKRYPDATGGAGADADLPIMEQHDLARETQPMPPLGNFVGRTAGTLRVPYVALNTGGLALSMAVFLVRVLYVMFEASLKHWLDGHQQIYLVEGRSTMTPAA